MKQMFRCEVCEANFETAKEALECERDHVETTCKEIQKMYSHLLTICKHQPALNLFVGKEVKLFDIEYLEVAPLGMDEKGTTPYIKVWCKEREKK